MQNNLAFFCNLFLYIDVYIYVILIINYWKILKNPLFFIPIYSVYWTNIVAFLKTFLEPTDLYDFGIFVFYLVSRLDNIRKHILYEKNTTANESHSIDFVF